MVKEVIKIPKFGTVYGVREIEELVALIREEGINRIRPFSLEDVGEMLYRGGDEAWDFILSTDGFYTGESAVYTSEEILLTGLDRSLLFRDSELIKKIITRNAVGEEFFLEPNISDVFRRTGEFERGRLSRNRKVSNEKPPEQRSVYVLDSYGSFWVPIENLGSDGLTRWAFKPYAEFVGRFLQEKGKESLPFRFLGNDYLSQLRQYSSDETSENPDVEESSKKPLKPFIRPLGIGFPIEDRGNNRIAIIGNQGFFPDNIPVYFLKEAKPQKSYKQAA